MTVRILVGDAKARLATLPAQSVHCIMTSPPYYKVRDYQNAAQIGLEETPEQYIAALVEVFREARRVLRDDGVLWINIGDSYAAGGHGGGGSYMAERKAWKGKAELKGFRAAPDGLKPKDLIGIPWMLAFALRADGWYWRGDNHAPVIWGKPNGMPESTDDRPTRGHEVVHLFTKSRHYFYDAEAVRTSPAASTITRLAQDIESQTGSSRANGGGKSNGTMKAVGNSTLMGSPHGRHALGDAIPESERRNDKQRGHSRRHVGFNDRWDAMERKQQQAGGANLRSVWWIAPANFDGKFCTTCRSYFAGATRAALRTERVEIDGRKTILRYCACGSHDHWLSHFAVMPDRIAEICIRAGCPPPWRSFRPVLWRGNDGRCRRSSAARLHRHRVESRLCRDELAPCQSGSRDDGGRSIVNASYESEARPRGPSTMTLTKQRAGHGTPLFAHADQQAAE